MAKNLDDKDLQPIIDEPAIDREYTRPNISATVQELNSEIPEPVFMPPPVGGGADAPSGAAPKKEKLPPANPAMNGVPDKELNQGSEHVANVLLSAYEQLHSVANAGVRIPERRINKLQAEGKVDLNINIPYEMGKVAPAREVLEAYNEQVSSTFEVSKEFKKEVKPVLQRVLAKKGVAMTDEQMLMMLFAKDLGMKGFMFYNIKKQSGELITMIADATAAMREGNAAQGRVVSPVVPQQAPPTPPSAPMAETAPSFTPPPTEGANDNDFDPEEEDDDNLFEDEGVFIPAEPQTSADVIEQHYASMVAQKENTDLKTVRAARTVGRKAKAAKKPQRPRVPKRESSGVRGRKSKVAKDYITEAAAETSTEE